MPPHRLARRSAEQQRMESLGIVCVTAAIVSSSKPSRLARGMSREPTSTMPPGAASVVASAQKYDPVQRFNPSQNVGIDQNLGANVDLGLVFRDEAARDVKLGEKLTPVYLDEAALLRALRAVEVLERLGTAEARQALEALAKAPNQKVIMMPLEASSIIGSLGGLAQIVGLELDILKIDKSLITPALGSRSAARLLRGIVGLAESLHMRTVAEGVESSEEAFYLRAVGVDCGQGWLWSKAVPASEIPALLAKGFAASIEWRRKTPR